MNIERGTENTLLIPGRQRDDFYLIVFQSIADQSVYQYCIVENSGHVHGPLLLEFEEIDEATAVDGQVTLGVGDWNVLVYGQASDTNLDGSLSTRQVWTEFIRVISDDIDPAIYPPEGGGIGSAPDRHRCRYIRVCGTPEIGDTITWDGSAWSPGAPSGSGSAPNVSRLVVTDWTAVSPVFTVPVAQIGGTFAMTRDSAGAYHISNPGRLPAGGFVDVWMMWQNVHCLQMRIVSDPDGDGFDMLITDVNDVPTDPITATINIAVYPQVDPDA